MIPNFYASGMIHTHTSLEGQGPQTGIVLAKLEFMASPHYRGHIDFKYLYENIFEFSLILLMERTD